MDDDDDKQKSDCSSSDSSSSEDSSSNGSSSCENEVTSESDDAPTKKSTAAAKDLKRLAEAHPDLYGVRRSSRSRHVPQRLELGQESDSDEPPTRRRVLRNNRCPESSDCSSSVESDDFVPKRCAVSKRRRALGRKASRRKKPAAAEWSEDSSDEQRVNARGATQVHSYKEDTDDETDEDDIVEVTYAEEEVNNNETIEKVMLTKRGNIGATGSKTAVYNVEEKGNPSVAGGELETQYQIKWKNWANIHNTWESEKSLREQNVNGMKKLQNYQKAQADLALWRNHASPEDREYFDCQQEMKENLVNIYCQVERIITSAAQRGTGGTDYMVKWCGLPYAESTWEDGALIESRFPEAIKEFRHRQNSQCIPNKYCKVLKYRPKFVKKTVIPDYLSQDGKYDLRDYQLDGLNWLVHSWCKANSAILADEMGLGKTIQTIAFLSLLMHDYQLYGPFLLVVPLSTIPAWQVELGRWAPTMNSIIYLGDIQSRDRIREWEWKHPGNKRLKFNTLVTTYEILLKDKAFLGGLSWAVLGVDEAHRLKNDDSLLYKALISFDTNHRLLITGTPLQNSLRELWSLLHFIMPDKFDSWEDFEAQYSLENEGISQLHKVLEPYLLRRVKKDVEKSLPNKTEQILRVEMTRIQKQYYKWILTKNYSALNKGLKGSVSSFINIMMELKKCCNHAFLTRPDEYVDGDRLEVIVKGSGKLILLDKLLMRLKKEGHRVLIFSQMVRMLDIIAEYMSLRHFQYQRLDGTIRGEVRRQALDHFNADNSIDFCFLLSTRAGGLGINLATADTVIIFDSDWNPQNDIQAMARAHRIGQKNQVSVYRLVTKSSVEEDIIERAKRKMVLDHLVIQRMDTTGRTVLKKTAAQSSSTPFSKEEMSAILKFGAADLFKETEEGEDEPQVDIDEILNRAETREMDDGNSQKANDLLSQFKVVSFDNLENEELEKNIADWGDIIPKADIDAMTEEEKKLKMKEMEMLGPRERKKIVQLNYPRGSAKSDDSEDEDSGSEKKKRGRRGANKMAGFTDAEVRRFVKSFKKFGKPLTRLEEIATDAELAEKSSHDLMSLGNELLSNCQQAMEEWQKQREMPDFTEKKTHRGPTFKLSNVQVNAKSVLNAIEELEPLAAMMSSDKSQREKWQIPVTAKPVHWDCEWDQEDDTRLLRGIYELGYGNWEAIKMDPNVGLHEKILLDGDSKPQAKHLISRTEQIFKLLRKVNNSLSNNSDSHCLEKVAKRKRGASKNPRIKSAEIVEGIDDDEDDNNADRDAVLKASSLYDHNKENKEKKKKKNKAERKLKGNSEVAGETEKIDEGKDTLSDKIFARCKESMRPVKKYLKRLDPSDESLTDAQQLKQTRAHLVTIGQYIEKFLKDYDDVDEAKSWKHNLWKFVAYFNSKYNSSQLMRIFKHANKSGKKKSSPKEAAALKSTASEKQEKKKRSHHKHLEANSVAKRQRTSGPVQFNIPVKSEHSVSPLDAMAGRDKMGGPNHSGDRNSWNSWPRSGSFDRKDKPRIDDYNSRNNVPGPGGAAFNLPHQRHYGDRDGPGYSRHNYGHGRPDDRYSDRPHSHRPVSSHGYNDHGSNRPPAATTSSRDRHSFGSSGPSHDYHDDVSNQQKNHGYRKDERGQHRTHLPDRHYDGYGRVPSSQSDAYLPTSNPTGEWSSSSSLYDPRGRPHQAN